MCVWVRGVIEQKRESCELDYTVHISTYFQQATTFISVVHQDHFDYIINEDVRQQQ